MNEEKVRRLKELLRRRKMLLEELKEMDEEIGELFTELTADLRLSPAEFLDAAEAWIKYLSIKRSEELLSRRLASLLTKAKVEIC
ncbi:MAG: hypothetical protein DRP11_00485 [Candidatus Aenigmatarchaeota archaeon]|nr:MAG: hypothetical protein DRP11_00485 [Candidatus Aenigmarchaeota archaeon]